MPLKKDFKVNNIEYRPDFKLKVIPELSLVKKIGDKYILYSPLNLKIYILSKDEYKRLNNKNISDTEKRTFFEDDILILENLDPYPKLNTKAMGPMVFLTTRCNLKCIYCFSKGGDISIDSSFDSIKALIDLWSKSPGKKDKISLFSSGEPTLAFGLMKKTYEYTKKKLRKSIEATIVTNGTFSKAIADWVIKNNVKVQISCDGPPQIQDFQRPIRRGPKSSKIIEKNLKYFVKKGYKNYYTHSVITSECTKKMDEILNYFYRLRVEDISSTQVFMGGRSKKELLVNKKEYIENSLKNVELAEAYGVNYISDIIPYRIRVKYCGIGSILALHENGLISSCTNSFITPKTFDFFKIGEYDGKKKCIKIDNKKRGFLVSRTADKIKECRDCILKWNCAGGCAFAALRRNNTIFSPDYYCEIRNRGLEEFVDYKVQKDFIKIKPALEIIGKNLYYSMIFNKFKLHKINNGNVKPNSFIKISTKTNLDFLAKKIIETRNSNGYKTSVFLLSFNLSGKNRNLGNRIVNFLKILKDNRIFFIVTKPMCKELFGENYRKVFKEFRIPKNWYESLELFKLKGNKALLVNSRTMKVKKETKRIDIYEKINGEVNKKTKLQSKECNLCKYRVRNNCEYIKHF